MDKCLYTPAHHEDQSNHKRLALTLGTEPSRIFVLSKIRAPYPGRGGGSKFVQTRGLRMVSVLARKVIKATR